MDLCPGGLPAAGAAFPVLYGCTCSGQFTTFEPRSPAVAKGLVQRVNISLLILLTEVVWDSRQASQCPAVSSFMMGLHIPGLRCNSLAICSSCLCCSGLIGRSLKRVVRLMSRIV